MKKLFLLLLLAASPLFAQTLATVTGHLSDPSGAPISNRTVLHAELSGDGGQVCRVNGANWLGPTSQDFKPTAGAFSFSLVRNDVLTCGTQTGLTLWNFTIIRDGTPQPSCALSIASSSVNLDTATCASTSTVVAPPTGPSIVANPLNNGPQTIAGPLTVSGASTVSGGNVTLAQPSAATSGANQSSFSWLLQGSFWNGSASATDQWSLSDVLGSGSNPASTLTLSHSGSSGTASVNLGSIPFSAGAVTVGGPLLGGSIFPSNIRWSQEGASITLGYDPAGDTYISSQTPGSGYSGTGTATVNGGTCNGQPAVGVVVNPSGGLTFALTDPGRCTVVPTSITFTGFTGGSGASATIAFVPQTGSIGNFVYLNPWPKQMTNLPALKGKVVSYTNYAVGGTTVSDALARFTTNGYQTICSNAAFSEYFGVGGDLARNSIATSLQDAPTTYTQWLALTHALKNAGCTVVVSTMLPQGINAGLSSSDNTIEQARQQFNSLVRNGVQGVDYDYLLDFGAQVDDPQTTWFYALDHLHLTFAGHTALAQMGNAALMAGGGPTAIGAPFTRSVVNGSLVSLACAGAYAQAAYSACFDGVTTAHINSYSTTAASGSIAFEGRTSAGVGTQYLLLNINGASSSANVMSTSCTGFPMSASGSFCFDGSTAMHINSYSTTGTSGTVAIEGRTSAGVGTQYVSFSTGGAQFNVTPIPQTAGGFNMGSLSLPWASIYIGAASTNNIRLVGTATAQRTATLPDASITVSGATAQDCGTTTTCSATNISATVKIVKGSVALASGTPSTATVTGFSPAFTSSSTFVCTATNATTQANPVKVVNASASSITLTGPNTVTDTVNYICVGN